MPFLSPLYTQNGELIGEDEKSLSLEQIINIINAGGYVCGVGEWRPERDGQYGMFHVTAT